MKGTKLSVVIGERLLRRLKRLAREIDVSPEDLAARAIQLGLDAATGEQALKLMDEALEPLRRAAKKHKGKSLREVAKGE